MRRLTLTALIVGISVLGVLMRGGDTPTVRARPRQPNLQIAVGCSGDSRSITFSLTSSESGATVGTSATPRPPAALDAGEPRVAVTCQAIALDAAASDMFAIAPGTMSFGLAGPAIIVESGGQSAQVTCGTVDQAESCQGGELIPSGGPGVLASGTLQFAVHLALAPGAALPALPAAQAIQLQATYQPADGSDAASAGTSVDINPPRVGMVLKPDLSVIGSGVSDAAIIALLLRHVEPVQCTPIVSAAPTPSVATPAPAGSAAQIAPYEICPRSSDPPGAPGAEAGSILLTTTLGMFANGEQHIVAECGAATPPPPLVVPPAGSDSPFPYTCTDVRVKLRPAGRAGEAVITALFTGAITGATAMAETRIVVAPRPTAIQLNPGCTEVLVPASLPPGTPVTVLAESVVPPQGVVSIWRRGDGGAWLNGYLRDSDVPPDFTTLNPGDQITVCTDRVVEYPVG